MKNQMTQKQRKARNEAYQLLSIAERILGEAGLTAYAEEIARSRAGMEMDSKLLTEQERNRRLPGVSA